MVDGLTYTQPQGDAVVKRGFYFSEGSIWTECKVMAIGIYAVVDIKYIEVILQLWWSKADTLPMCCKPELLAKIHYNR